MAGYKEVKMEDTIESKKWNKLWIFPFTVISLVAGLYVPLISLFLLVMQMGWMFFADDEDIAALVLFTLPFASVFKISTDMITLFTVVEIVVVMIMMFRTKKCSSYLLIGTIIFALYTILTPNRDYISTIKLIILIFIFYYLIPACRKALVYVIVAFVTGLLLSSVMACFRDYIPVISSYVAMVEDYTTVGMIERFSGLYPDPNYYSANIIIAKFSLLALYNNKYIKKLFWILSIPLTIFGFMTVSKSFVFIYCLYIFSLMLSYAKKKNFIWIILIGIFMCGALWLVQTSNLTLFVNLRARFDYNDINSFTTGRVGIADTYLQYIFNNWKTLLFGDGIGADLLFAEGKYIASHNFYIDLLYYFGILGSVLFVIILGIVISKNKIIVKRNLITYMPIISLAIMYISLSTLLFIDFPFHLLLAVTIYNMEENNEEVHRLSTL